MMGDRCLGKFKVPVWDRDAPLVFEYAGTRNRLAAKAELSLRGLKHFKNRNLVRNFLRVLPYGQGTRPSDLAAA